MRRERPRRAAAGATGDRGGDPGTRGGSRRGVVRTEHFGQKTLLVCMRGTSLWAAPCVRNARGESNRIHIRRRDYGCCRGSADSNSARRAHGSHEGRSRRSRSSAL